jgi:hypothetical protein
MLELHLRRFFTFLSLAGYAFIIARMAYEAQLGVLFLPILFGVSVLVERGLAHLEDG